MHQRGDRIKQSEGKEKSPLSPLEIPRESDQKGLTKHERGEGRGERKGGGEAGKGGEVGLLGESVWNCCCGEQSLLLEGIC